MYPHCFLVKKQRRYHLGGFGLPNKSELYETLSNSRLSPYLPRSQAIKDCSDVVKALKVREESLLNQ